LLVSDENFFWLETCELLDTFIDVSRGKVFITSVHLSIGFLNNWNPDLMKVSASTEDWF
jgi:hypothetical protein